MNNLTLNDSTQVAIIRHLHNTERLLAKVASKLSNQEKNANITPLADLGMPLNASRFIGGFYTGAYYSWDESEVPFVPVDSTINCCGVSMYKISLEIESEEQFKKLIADGITKIENETTYINNLAKENHFVNYCKSEGSQDLEDGYYVVHHSSASEFKSQANGLYPVVGNWYYNDIKVIEDKQSNRYIRYVEGKLADRFFKIAKMLEEFNRLRHEYIVGAIFGENNIESEISNVQHFGMPGENASNISIGANWLDSGEKYVLLTDRKQPLYLVKNIGNESTRIAENKFLAPHGLGMKHKNQSKIDLEYTSNGIILNGKAYTTKDRLSKDVEIEVRSSENNDAIVNEILNICPGEIVGKLTPIFGYDSYSKS